MIEAFIPRGLDMAGDASNPLLRHIRRLVGLPEDGPETDGQLLEWFVARRDEAAFEALLSRHGPMVLGTCRRILRDRHDVEDAFQAAFLVLCRKAGSISSRGGGRLAASSRVPGRFETQSRSRPPAGPRQLCGSTCSRQFLGSHLARSPPDS